MHLHLNSYLAKTIYNQEGIAPVETAALAPLGDREDGQGKARGPRRSRNKSRDKAEDNANIVESDQDDHGEILDGISHVLC